ncbi:MAG: nicotinic acid mononucleotide adenyltransferase [Leeuwenhoekiella sp.]
MKRFMMVALLMGNMLWAVAQEEQTPKNKFVKIGNVIEATLYHDNGEVSQIGNYDNDGKLQGLWKSYDKNGKKLAVAHYESGEKVGKWFFWKNDVLTEVDYSKSSIVAVNTWTLNGEQVVSNE